MNRSALVRFALAAGLLAVLPMQPSSAYSLKTYKWATTDVPFYVNPANLDVATSSFVSAR